MNMSPSVQDYFFLFVIIDIYSFIAVQVRTGNKKYFIWIVKSIVFFIMKEISSKIYRDDMTE